jgi:hypothetical protein
MMDYIQFFKEKNKNFVVSYLLLRKLIGILGMILPIACLLGGSVFQHVPVRDSISSYYHSNMRDVLVGLLVGVSLFLMAYKGYERRDMIMAITSGIAGLGIAIFPCAIHDQPAAPVGMFQIAPPFAGYLHFGSSALFFVLLGINSFFLFTIGDTGKRTRRKRIRNGIYRTCGLVIFGSLIALLALHLVLGEQLADHAWTFVFETVMLWAFGISWLVKGKTFCADRKNEKRSD